MVPEAHGPLKLHGPRGHSRWPCLKATSAEAQGRGIFSHCLFFGSRRSSGSSLSFRAGSHRALGQIVRKRLNIISLFTCALLGTSS